MVKKRESVRKKHSGKLPKGKNRRSVFSHGLMQPEWPKKGTNGEDLGKALFSSKRGGSRKFERVNCKLRKLLIFIFQKGRDLGLKT